METPGKLAPITLLLTCLLATTVTLLASITSVSGGCPLLEDSMAFKVEYVNIKTS